MEQHKTAGDIAFRDRKPGAESRFAVKLTPEQAEAIKAKFDLTPTEFNILSLFLLGISDRQAMAGRLLLTKDEFEQHLANAFHKLQVRNEIKAVEVMVGIDMKEVSRKFTDVSYELVLTKRELQILPLLVLGCTNAEIAKELNIHTTTLKYHIQKLAEKLGLRAEDLGRGMRERIIEAARKKNLFPVEPKQE